MRALATLWLAACVSKGKYQTLADDQEALYQRVDGMTAAMNGMSADLTAAKEAEKAAVDELARARAAIEGEGGKVADLSQRLGELAAVEAREAERAASSAAAAVRHQALTAALEPLAAARVVTLLRRGDATVVELPAGLVLDGDSVNDAGRKALGAVVDALGDNVEPVVAVVALDGKDAWPTSARAAASVAAALLADGVASTRLAAVGVGDSRPAPDGGRAGARRVELVVGGPLP